MADNAPIWRFLGNLRATENPDESRVACRGLFIIEVFPALALPAFNVNFYGHRQGPKYNPDNRKQFRQSDWCAVANTIAQYARAVPIDGLETWAHETAKIETPVKGHQDQIDAVLCALIGYHWRTRPREHSIMIGDLANGYMISPASVSIVERLKMKAMKLGIQLQKSA